MKAITVLKALAAFTEETIKTQFIVLHDRAHARALFGNGGAVTIGGEGIPEGVYLYLYLNDPEQRALADALSKACQREEGHELEAAAFGSDCCGQPLAVYNVSE